jgi:hypothetical protein
MAYLQQLTLQLLLIPLVLWVMEIQICFNFFSPFQENCWSLEPILGLILTLNTQYAKNGFLQPELKYFLSFCCGILRLDLF